MDIKVTLFAMGIVLMYIANRHGKSNRNQEFESTGLTVLDPLKAVMDQFKSTLPAAGFIILILGGYSAHNDEHRCQRGYGSYSTKPIKKIKSVYILVPLVFLIGNVLSLVIPSAPTLAIILLATLYPVLRQAGMSPVDRSGSHCHYRNGYADSSGGDNVAVATELAKYPAFAGMSVTDYVIQDHAMISVPTLIVMAVVHFFLAEVYG